MKPILFSDPHSENIIAESAIEISPSLVLTGTLLEQKGMDPRAYLYWKAYNILSHKDEVSIQR